MPIADLQGQNRNNNSGPMKGTTDTGLPELPICRICETGDLLSDNNQARYTSSQPNNDGQSQEVGGGDTQNLFLASKPRDSVILPCKQAMESHQWYREGGLIH